MNRLLKAIARLIETFKSRSDDEDIRRYTRGVPRDAS